MNNGKTYLKTGNLIYFFSAFLADGSLSVNGRSQEIRTKKGRAGHLFNNNPMGPVVSVVHFFPVFLPINFGLGSNETGQKVIITADPTEVKNVIIKLGGGKLSG